MFSNLLQLLAETNHPGGLFMPIRASSVAAPIDYLMWYINTVAVVFTLLIFVLTIWFCIKFHYKKNPVAKPTGHNNVLELTWTAIPTVIVFVMFFWGFFVYMGMFAPASEKTTAAYEVRVEAYKWGWKFFYKHPQNGREVMATELFLPVNQPVRLVMGSVDVIHSLYLPAFRMKKDVVPGRFNKMEVTGTMVGTFDLFCTEYCGDLHSKMLTKAKVFELNDFNAAIIKAGTLENNILTAPELGKIVATMNGCFGCHADGTDAHKAAIGPSWKNMYGKMESFTDGSTGLVDDNYVAESIRYPARKLVAAYPGGGMAAYNLSDREIGYLVAYMKSISDKVPQQTWEPVPVPSE
jgi:cytochrome c oxidase subunit II